MKLMSLLVSAAVLSGSMLYSVESKANDQLALSLCEYIAADDKSRLRKTLKDARLKIRDVNDAIQCNGNSLLRHAIASNAADAGEYIVKSIPKSQLEDGADVAWAESNGLGGSPVVAAIKERAGL